jgi:methylenetetrahydrofolate dehydrogenase (NADP+)/methenyltetrahydrofolate cyclohydrolase
MILIDGRKAREHFLPILQARIKALSFVPKLAIIQVGDRDDSSTYIRGKKAFASKIGIDIVHEKLNENTNEQEIISSVEKFNKDKTIQGIIIQLPLPVHLDSEKIINLIDPNKDTDGLVKNTKYIPATARGIRELFQFYNIDLKNKKVAMLGRSKIVGKPTALMCEKEGAIVTICHKETKDIPSITQKSDIVIVAIGQPKLIDEKYFSKDVIVIDVGITRDSNEGLVGDVNFDKVKNIVGMITPVPGGVGQMTMLAIFENLVDVCYNV